MSTILYPTNFPPQTNPVIDKTGNMTIPGTNFWKALWNRTGGGTGIVNSTANIVTAAGQTLTNDITNITAGGGSTAILAALEPGQQQLVRNVSGGNVTISPASGTIDGGATFVLATTKSAIFSCVASGVIVSFLSG